MIFAPTVVPKASLTRLLTPRAIVVHVKKRSLWTLHIPAVVVRVKKRNLWTLHIPAVVSRVKKRSLCISLM
jgi:hypothetical protein